jgi:peptide chain release factor 3
VLGHFPARHEAASRQARPRYAISNPVLFFAQERETADEAVAGDVIGIPNHGLLSVGDS